MPLFKDQQEHILQLCGDEYTIIEAIDGFYSSKRMKLRHNLCGTEYDVKIKTFLIGRRCPNRECCDNKRKNTNLERFGTERASKSQAIKDKTKQTNLDKYGVIAPMQREECRAKARQTCIEKYGVENPAQNKEIQEKTKQTCIEKYGVECTTQSKEVKEKAKQTNLQKYGVENPMQSKEIQDKLRRTNLQQYGVEYVGNRKDIQDKIKQTCLQKYGIECVFENQSVQEQIKQTMLQKYGVQSYTQTETSKKKTSEQQLEKFYNNLQDKYPLLQPCFSENEYRGVFSKKYKFRCKECGYEFERTIHCNQPICRKCNPPLRGTSKQEAEVCKFISSIAGSCISLNIRSIIPPQELDIYSEQHRVGVEFNGLYWHSEEFVDKKYHSEKSKLAREAGIKLFHIFSDEWEQKQDIVKSMLSHAFGVTQQKLFARKCNITEVSTRDAKRFFESTHISGGGRSKSAFGLFYDGQLVSCLSLGIPIKNKRYSNCIEIVRFANQLNMHVVGGFSKLLAAAKRWSLENGFENILSYADLRFGDGNVYRKNGFEYLGDTDVNYWYIDGINRYSRQSFCARDGKTERQIAEEAGVLKIYGCGHAIFLLNLR